MLTPKQAQKVAAELFLATDGGETDPVHVGAQPESIGDFRIIRVIASGGMGTVYEAQQEHPRRTVALKVLKREMISRTALRRFEHESEILARLHHPNIAQVYEAGTHDDGFGGVPFFAMEFIEDAQSVTHYAESKRLDQRQRLEMFAHVCDAVHHGHQKGVIHRDLKPANVLIDSSGTPKVIDFGIARATDADVALTTLHTDAKTIIGTLQYMSPEQCSGGDPEAHRGGVDRTGFDIDSRSDVYSLGVILYELVCGRLPYVLSETSIPHALRVIQERDPPYPGTIRITPRVNRSLEAVVLKALEKDRESRYPSVAELGADIRRYLGGDPVEARAPSSWMRGVRWVGRHPIASTTVLCLFLASATIATTMISIWFLNSRPHRVAISHDGRAAQLVAVDGRVLQTWDTRVGRGVTFAELVDRPPELGGDRIVLIGFSALAQVSYPRSICAYSAADSANLIWHREISHIPSEVGAPGRDSMSYHVAWGLVEDIFPESESRGPEIVIGFSGIRGPCPIQIYSMSGQLLWQIWHEGTTQLPYWLRGPSLLVLCGVNSEVIWPSRGETNAAGDYPIVLFGIKPRVGFCSDGILPNDMDSDSGMAWYRCLLPPPPFENLTLHPLQQSSLGFDPGSCFEFLVGSDPNGPGFAMTIDQNGQEVANTRTANDKYKRDPSLRSYDSFKLGDLPPANPK